MIPTGALPAGLWSARDRRLLVGRMALGAVLVAAAWWFAAGEADVADQLGFASLSVAGALVGMYGIFSWVSRGRRSVGRRAQRLLGSAPGANVAVASAETLVAGGDRHWFHRSDCLLAVARAWSPASRSDHERAGRRPCPACKP